MSHSNSSPWRLPLSPASDFPKHQYHLQHTMSMLNLHDEPPSWSFNRSVSPTVSSTSSTTSRSATPTNSNNPWSSVMASPTSSGTSPKDSPSRTPQYTSRSTTPVAPQPLRPIPSTAGFTPLPMSPPPSSGGDSFRGSDYPTSPVPSFPASPTPNPYRSTVVSLPPLNNAFVTPSLLTQYGRMYPELLRRQGWERSTAARAYTWALSNPRTSLLLALCEDIAAWPKAGIFGLTDDGLPFREGDLHRIAANPKRVVDFQWRVTAKELPQNGQHSEFTSRETVPLQQVGSLRSSGNSEKVVDRVQWLGESDERILVRKRFFFTRPQQKVTLLNQIQDYKRLEHKNIARLICSYSQSGVLGIITPIAQCNLDDYLSLPVGDINRARLLLEWIHDLAQALDYLHAQSIPHRGIRPRKILVDGSRILLAPFGISADADSHSPTSPVPPKRLDQLQAYFQDQSYLYAAPEVIIPRGKKPGRPADVFSLGCVFLSMMTVIKSQSLATFAQYRAGGSHDVSFHANPERVSTWRLRLQATTTGNGLSGSGLGRREQQLKLETNILDCIEAMTRLDPSKRIKMRKVAPFLARCNEGKSGFASTGTGGGRRRSLDGLGGGNLATIHGYPGKETAKIPAVNGVNAANASVLNTGRTTELANLEAYFSPRRYEDSTGNWGSK